MTKPLAGAYFELEDGKIVWLTAEQQLQNLLRCHTETEYEAIAKNCVAVGDWANLDALRAANPQFSGVA